MSDDVLNIFDEEPEAELPEAAPAEPEQTEGKGEDTAAPPAAQEDNSRFVPISALLDEREKRQKAAQELEELRRWRAEVEARSRKPPPDLLEDPEARLAMERQQIAELIVQDRVERSRFLAAEKYGAEMVDEVTRFFDNPALHAKSAEFLSHPFPMEAAIAFYRQQKALAEIGDDPVSYRNRLEQELREKLMAEMAKPSRPSPNAPPPSIAGTRAAGSATEPPKSAFDALFGG